MGKDTENKPSRFYVGVMTGLFSKRHADIMGEAIYIYGYLLSKVTGWNKTFHVGAILSGRPIKLKFIEEETGFPSRTIRRHIKKLEEYGYIFTLRSARGMKYFITNYKPAGKPRLKTGDLPKMAVLKLSQVATHSNLRGHQVATHEGIYDIYINTEDTRLKSRLNNPNQPMYEYFLLMKQLFDVEMATAELRFFFRGYKKSSSFIDPDTLLKAIARALMSHRQKITQQEKAGRRPVGLGNVVAYINAGLHGRNPYLLRERKNEFATVEEVKSTFQQIVSNIKKSKEGD